MPHVGRAVGTQDAHAAGEDDQEGHDGEHTGNLGQYEVACRVDAHDFQGVNLLRDAHGAQLGGNVRADFSGQDETHDAAGELEQHNLARGVTCHPAGHPRTLDVELHLDANHGTYEERDEQHDADGVDTQLGHLLDILFPEHAHPFGHRKRASHQDEVATEGGQPSV